MIDRGPFIIHNVLSLHLDTRRAGVKRKPAIHLPRPTVRHLMINSATDSAPWSENQLFDKSQQ